MEQKVLTFGCRLNFYESSLIEAELAKLQANTEIIVINSCAVTNEAEKQVKQSIRKIHRQSPDKKIIVTGCAAQLNPDSYANMQGVFKVLGNIEKLDYKNYTSKEDVCVGDISKVKKQPIKPARFLQKSRAFLQIQNGCDHDCTFCAITTARGNNRSIPPDIIISEIKSFVAQGFAEVVLTGVDITDYGKDIFGKPSLSVLIKRILQDAPQLARLRLSSIDVAEVDDLLIDLLKNEERLMPHLHISFQSGDKIILKRMKRRHSPKDIINFYQRATKARDNIGFGADVIAGFPTETEEHFNSTYNLIRELQIPYLHVFPFSAKSGTKAALMPQVPNDIKKTRAKALIELGKQNLQKFYQKQIGKYHKIVLEKNNIGRSQNFCLAKLLDNTSLKAAETAKVKIISADQECLSGVCI